MKVKAGLNSRLQVPHGYNTKIIHNTAKERLNGKVRSTQFLWPPSARVDCSPCRAGGAVRPSDGGEMGGLNIPEKK